MVCCNEVNQNAGGPLARLRVAEGFDLLFLGKGMAGWILEAPERFLVEGWESPHRSDKNPRLAQLLWDYLRVVSLPGIERIDDGDQEALSDLRSLEQRALAANVTDPRSGILQRAAARLLMDT
jgi:hypothetical protein